jgi:Domain of unknown function (DUF932)
MKDYSNLTADEVDALTSAELVEYLSQSSSSDESAPVTEAAEVEEVEAPLIVATPTGYVSPVVAPVAEADEAPAVDADVFGAIPATDKIEEALTFGGLDFDVETFPMKPVLTGIGDEDGSPEPEEDWIIPTFVGIRRADDRKTVFAVQHNTYAIFQNRDILEYIKPLIEATGGTFTRVGTYLKGARVFAFLTLREKIALPGGASLNQELVITSSHDGSHCLSVRTAATLSNGTIIKQGRAYDLRHTKNVHIRTKEVIKIMEVKSTFFSDLAEKVAKLSDIPMSDDEAEIFLKKFLEFPEQKDVTVHPVKVAAKDAIVKAFREAVAGGQTKLAMALAIAHYECQSKPVKETKKYVSEKESRFRSMMTGTSGKDVETAWVELLREEEAPAAV